MEVLIIDDKQTNLDLFSHMLEMVGGIHTIQFDCPQAALTRCMLHTPDLVLVDYMMPAMDGLEFLRRFRALPGMAVIPVIMVTAATEVRVRHEALRLSANDFLTKPVNCIELNARAGNLLALRAAQLQLAQRADWLDQAVRRATADIVAREHELIVRLSRTAEYRDPETGAHLRRMAEYARLTAVHLGLGAAECDLIRDAAPMHDIGKVGIPDRILLKPGRFEPYEMEIMKTHTTIGRDAIEAAERELGVTVDFLKYAKEIAYGHQEKWDGSGYPLGLSGDAIPISARLMAVADVYDALISRRVYKEGMSHEAAVAIITEGRGKHFDPDMVDAFLELQAEFIAIARAYADSDHDMAQKRERVELFTKVGA